MSRTFPVSVADAEDELLGGVSTARVVCAAVGGSLVSFLSLPSVFPLPLVSLPLKSAARQRRWWWWRWWWRRWRDTNSGCRVPQRRQRTLRVFVQSWQSGHCQWSPCSCSFSLCLPLQCSPHHGRGRVARICGRPCSSLGRSLPLLCEAVSLPVRPFRCHPWRH